MGTGAISGDAPYADVEAALADGKTQEEIDSYKASPGRRRVAPQLTMTAAMKREMDLVMKRWNKQDDEIDSWESSLKSRAAACKKEGLVQLAAFDSQQGVTVVEDDDPTTPAASSGDTNRTLPDHVRRACITKEGGGGGVGRVPVEALEVRALASEAELQLLLAWLYQDETDERNSPNCWFSRASASLVHAFDEGRLFGTFFRAGESRVREKRTRAAAGRGGGRGGEVEVEDGGGDEDSAKLTAGVTCSSAVMLPGVGEAEGANLKEKESNGDCAKDGDKLRDLDKAGDKAVSECGLNGGDKNGHADIIGVSDGEVCAGGATPPRISGEPQGDTQQQEKDGVDGNNQTNGKNKTKDADTSRCAKLTSSSVVGTRTPPRRIASCPIAFCATKHVEVVGANSDTTHELIDATGVRRNCRGVGLGRFTAEYFVERARAAGREGYEVEAHPGANGFWRKLGFRPDTTSKQQKHQPQSQSIYCAATNKTCQKMTVVFPTNDYIRNYL